MAAPNQPHNPYEAPAIENEMAFTGEGYTRSHAAAIVRNEFAHGPDPMPCDCGDWAFYKPGPGCMKCPSCGALYMCNGERI